MGLTLCALFHYDYAMTHAMTHLVFYKNGSPLLKYPITKEKLSIGREPSCDIVLPDEDISRLHCEISKMGGKFQVKNLSRNGTFINGKRADNSAVNEGDQIKLGGWTAKLARGEAAYDRATVSKGGEATKIINYDAAQKVITSEAIELTIKSATGKKSTRTLKTARVNIGSAETNDIIIDDDDYISRKHCRLAFENDDLFLIDLGSTNRTFYEGEEVDKIALPRRAKFTVGKTEITIKRIEEKEKLHPESEAQMGHMIGVSDSMKEIFALIRRVAATDATVCITGESGTGKELVARSIHDLSNRVKAPFVAINCGAIPPNIIESELFGHEKGAFTGAIQTHRGVFEQAHTGTLFLDEIGEMPADLQTRLLRALETKTVRRIGGHRDIPVDARVIAATNCDLKQKIRQGKFREDLFFRLYLIPIHIPPLRERREDIESLANHFAKLFSADETERAISPKAMERLMRHNWAGNVRELKNTIQRAVIMHKGGAITASDISLTELRGEKDSRSMPLISQEKEAVVKALRQSKGNQSKAAHILGIARTTLANKIKKYEIDISMLSLDD